MSLNCMKCGRETVDNEGFCAECLAEMEKYPVRPGMVIYLPRRREEPAPKKSHSRRKAAPSPEEQVKRLKKLVHRQSVAIVVLILLLLAVGHFAGMYLLDATAEFLPGQNYNAITDVFSGK